MSQELFSEFMNDQCAAIAASGLDELSWIEQNAEAFRASWEQTHNVH